MTPRPPVILNGDEVRVGMSIGIAIESSGAEVEDALEHADIAMYTAKSNGQGRDQRVPAAESPGPRRRP